MKKTAIIIDDERLARAELKKMLLEYPEIDVLAEASNANEAIELINQHDPHIIFLDIQMPEKNGFELIDMNPKMWHGKKEGYISGSVYKLRLVADKNIENI